MHLGNPHNFGRRVVSRGRSIRKPRPVLWEWLFSSPSSPLRKLLGLGFLPALDVVVPRGEVERVRLSPLRPSARTNAEVADVFGRALGLFAWMGVSDLHWENLVLGADRRGRVVFGALDIEMLLADLSLPTETRLLAEADPEYAAVYRHAAGVRRVLPYLGKPIRPEHLLSVVSAYRETLEALDRQRPSIAALLARLPGMRETPIRVTLRATADYTRARREPVWPPLLDAEAEQLARGDVPYFFRLYGERGIFYWRDEARKTRGRLPLRGDVPKLAPLLSLAQGLRSPSRRRLREEGLLAVIGALDHPSLTGRHRRGELEVVLTKRTLTVELDGERLACRRALGSVVGSAYLGCRCGEARSVFA